MADWIPVSERLPEKVHPDGSHTVLVLDSGFRFVASLDHDDGSWFTDDGEELYGVTHWCDCYLPEPLPPPEWDGEPPETSNG